MLKALALAGAMVLEGSLALLLLVWLPALTRAPEDWRQDLLGAAGRVLRRAAVAGTALAVAATVAYLLWLAYVTGADEQQPGPRSYLASLWDVAAQSGIGAYALLRIALVALAGHLAYRHAPTPARALTPSSAPLSGQAPAARPLRLAALLGALALATFSLSSHAVTTPGRASVPAAVLADFVHFLAAAVWGGGLACLVFLLGRRLAAGDLAPFVHEVVRRFSAAAAASVAAILGTGLLMTYQRLYGPTALFETRYGLDIVWKLVLLLAIFFVARDNLLVYRPRLARAAATGSETGPILRGLVTRVAVEAAGVAAVVLAAGFLTGTPPPVRQPVEVTVTIDGLRYDPPVLRWQRNRPVRLRLVNRDTQTHSFVVDDFPYEGLTSHVHGFTATGRQFALYTWPRQEAVAVITPLGSGTYRFFDALQDFADRGLVGQLDVR